MDTGKPRAGAPAIANGNVIRDSSTGLATQLIDAQQIRHMPVSLATFDASSKCAVSLEGMPGFVAVMEVTLPPPVEAPA